MKTKAELIVVPLPGTGHLVPTLELARSLTLRDDRISLTILLMDDSPISPSKPSPPPLPPTDRIRLVHLPSLPPPSISHVLAAPPILPRVSLLVDHYKPIIKHTVTRLVSAESTHCIDGFVFDVFTTNVLEVAEELGVPSYMYFSSGAAMLGLMLHLPSLHERVEAESGRVDSEEFAVPSYRNSVPLRAFPSFMFNMEDEEYYLFVHFSRKIREVKGILVNSFRELELYAVGSIEKNGDQIPKTYLVGPMISESARNDGAHFDPIMEFLDKQPRKSVIFLCFGSLGSLDAPQVTEMARGLERSGHRFLWSLRRPSHGDQANDTDLEEGIPEGFEERTAGRGLVIRGWVPQVKVLGHEAIGCFVSHCGWNSTLESVRSGVPMLTWPMYAEQKLNALELVREVGVGIEMRGWEKGEGEVTSAEEVERGVRSGMEGHVAEEVRERVGEMRESSRRAVGVGGSSYVSLGRFIEDLGLVSREV